MPTEAAAPAQEKQKDTAAPELAAPGFAAPSFGTSVRSHEQAILNLQQTAGNRAVVGLLGGAVQRAPLASGVQRAPEGGAERLDADGRAERARHAIDVLDLPGHKFMKVNVEALAAALDGMTEAEGDAVRMSFLGKFGWSLRNMLRDSLEIDGKKVISDLYPNSRKRLQLLLEGTSDAPAADPMQAMQTGQAVGEVVGSLIGKKDEVGQVFGAVAAVTVRDNNAAQAKQVAARRRTAQAIQLKTWIDGGRREPVFALLRGLGGKGKRDDRKALTDAFEAQFGTTLYMALTKKFKEKTDWDRFDALLFEDDLAKDDRVATKAHIDQVRQAEADAEKLPGGLNVKDFPGPLGDELRSRSKRVQDARAGLDAHLEEMRTQPAAPSTTGEAGPAKSRLDAALGEGTGTAAIRYEVGAKTGVRVDDLLDDKRRPTALASRLARKYLDKSIKPADVELVLRELRKIADDQADLEAREAESKGSVEPPPTADIVREAYFAQFHAEFETRAKKPLINVLSEIGTSEDRNRNLLLLLRQGERSDVSDLYLALRGTTKNMERVREILEGKTRTEIRNLAEDYEKFTGQDLGRALLGSPDEVRRIKFPTPDDILSGRVPKDLGKARKELDEKMRLLKGEYEVEPSAYVKDQQELVASLAATREREGTREATGAVPVSADMLADMSEKVNLEAERDRLRGEAQFILGRIVGREVSVSSNRGMFAITRDDLFGNIENDIVRGTRDDAIDAIRKLDHAIEQDPPDMALAHKQINYLYLADARMKHNLGVYEQRTEEAFNAFVDAAVLVVTTIVTAGGGGPIIAALKATAATLAVKLVAKGPDYLGSSEMWSDIRSGAFSAAGGKLAEKTVGKLANAYLEKVLEKAQKLGVTGALKTRATVGAIKAASWEAENLVSSGTSGGLEAIVQGSSDPFTEAVGGKAHLMAIGQHHAGGAIRSAKGAIASRRTPNAGGGGTEGPTAAPGPDGSRPGVETEGGALPAPDAATVGGARPIGPEPAPTLASAAPTGPGGDSLGSVTPPGRPRRPGSFGVGMPEVPNARARQAPLTTGEFEVPPSKYTAEQLGIRPGSALDTPRGRRNREEQLRREGKLPGPDGVARDVPYHSQLLEQSTGPTGGRRFAAELAPALENWHNLSLAERLTRIKAVVNRILADAGMPPVDVDHDLGIKAGDAAFSPWEWKIKISTETVLDSSPASFAALATAVAHETRHALHIFRGVRAGLHGNAAFTAPVRPDVLAHARAANANGGFDPAFRVPHPNVPGDRGSPAYGEAVDVIHETFGPGTAERPTAIGAGNAYRAAVRKLTFIKAVRDAAWARQPFDPHNANWAEGQLIQALADERAAHNAYVQTAPEADAHRAGPAAGKALIERLTAEGALRDAQADATVAKQQLDAAMVSGDKTRIEDALIRSQHGQDRVSKAKAAVDALDALTFTQPGPELAGQLGAEPHIPLPNIPGYGAGPPPMPGAGATVPTSPAPQGAAVSQGQASTARARRPTVPDPNAGSLGSIQPVGAGGSGSGPTSQVPAPPQNELLVWATEQRGPALERARAHLAAAQKAHSSAKQQLEDAKAAGGETSQLELEVSLAWAKIGDAEGALGQANNMAVRAQRVIEALTGVEPQSTKQILGASGPAGPTARPGASTTPGGGPAPGVARPPAGPAATTTPTGGKPRATSGQGEAREAPATGGSDTTAGGRNELLVWAAEQQGPALDTARSRLDAARKAREVADRRLAEAREGQVDTRDLELDAAMARAKEGDAEVALGQAQNMAVRAQRIAEGIAQAAARPPAAPSRPIVAPRAPAKPENELLVWATEQHGPALERARTRLAEAEKAHDAVVKQIADAKSAGADTAKLELEKALAWSKVGDAQVALVQAQNMAVRAQRVIEGIAGSQAAAANRAERRNVDPIDDPNIAARLFIEQRGFSGGNVAMQRPMFEGQWRGNHQQTSKPPAAAFRRADGSIVIDASNRRVREEIERLARERRTAVGAGG